MNLELPLNPDSVTLIKPTQDIKYAFNMYVPKDVKNIKNILLWGYSSGPYENYNEEIDFFNDQIKIIRKQCETFNFLAISVFLPKISSKEYPEYKLSSQMMTPETMFAEIKDTPDFYKRPDLKVLKILRIVKDNMQTKQLKFPEKILVSGASAGANFVNRFSLLYPNLIKASALFCTGDFIYPTNVLNGKELDYPFGTNNLDQILDNNFNADEFKKIPHYIYVGENDDKDPMQWELYFPKLIDRYREIVGASVLERTKNYAEFLKNNGNKVKLRVEPGIGHQIAKGVLDDGFEFLNSI